MKQPSRDIAKWFGVYTRSRCEKAVRCAMDREHIEHFLPTTISPRRHGSRHRIVEVPLIPGYIFVCITLKDYLTVLQVPNVIDLVRFGGELIPIPQEEIDVLSKFCGNIGFEVLLGEMPLRRGDTVEVMAGPLQGVVGELVTVQGGKNLIVELKNVGHSLQVVQMESHYVRRLSSVGA